MRTLATILLLAPLSAAQEIIPLYAGAAPGTESWTWEETVLPPTDGLKRAANVTRPTLTVFRPENPNGTAIVVAPGGGFRHLAIEHEGYDVARWLNSLGVTAFVLKYRVYRSGDDAEKAEAKQRRAAVIPFSAADGRAAVALVRKRAKEWALRTDRIGILGFSAGGWVTAAAALEHDAASRPDFAVPVYPAVPPGAQAPASPMPLLLIHATDDKTVSAFDNSVRLYGLWKSAGAPVEMHIYAAGGHGFGMRKKNLPSDTWTDRVRDWLAAQSLLTK